MLKEGVVAVLSQARKAEQQLPDNEVHHTHRVGKWVTRDSPSPAVSLHSEGLGCAQNSALGCRTALPKAAGGHQGTPRQAEPPRWDTLTCAAQGSGGIFIAGSVDLTLGRMVQW